MKINAITVPAGSGDELARRFAERAGAVDNQDGFEGFDLLKPTDGRDTWLVVTKWRDEAAFQAWIGSPSFAEGHRGVSSEGSRGTQARPHGAGGHPGGHPHGGGNPGGHPVGDPSASDSDASGNEQPVAVSSELWSFVVAGGSPGGAGRSR